VRDCALLLDAMIGASPDPEDAATALNPAPHAIPYAQGLNADALQGARLGVLRHFFTAHAGVAAAYAPVLAALERAGAVLIDVIDLPDMAALREAEKTVLLYEMKADLNTYLQRLGPAAPVRSLADVIVFNRQHADVELAWFGQDYLELAQDKGLLSSPDYLAARASCLRLARDEGIHGLLARHKLDALIAPTVGPAWTIDLLLGDHALPSSCSLAAVAGTPSITVPAALWQGLPLGLSWMGAAWSEQRLLNMAHTFEQLLQARRAPRFFSYSSSPE
jgi:amidase